LFLEIRKIKLENRLITFDFIMPMFERTELMIGAEKLECLKASHVLVVGLGGVGAYAAEMLCRAGVGKLTLIDSDKVSRSNKNRQLLALDSTEGMLKTEVLAERLKDINKDVELVCLSEYLKDERMLEVLKETKYDYVIDAIDTLSPKLYLIAHCVKLSIPVVSSMGSGGKLNPSLVQVADISQSYNCPLARMIRKHLHKFGIYEGVNVVFSSEEVPKDSVKEERSENKRTNVGTISYMPAIFGCFAASVVIRDLIGELPKEKLKDTRYYHNKKTKISDIIGVNVV
jgi:tRNA A37 threonylcarbamoyladenosine dehydratase